MPPLLQAFFRLRAEGVPFSVTMSITPPLAAMLDDTLLRARYRRHLGRLRDLAESEVRGNHPDSRIGRLARHYQDRFRSVEQFDNLASPANCDIVTLAHKADLEQPLFTSGKWGVIGMKLREPGA